jgi:hypothetical protein
MTDPRYTVALTVGGVVNLALAWVLARSSRALPLSFFLVIALCNAAMLFVISRMVTPYLIVPGLACAMMLAFAMHNRFGKTWVLTIGLGVGMLGPWLGTVAGLWDATWSTANGALLLRSPAGEFILPNAELAHHVYSIALIFVAGLLVRTIGKAQRDAQRSAHLHAWHLRQLMPIAAV